MNLPEQTIIIAVALIALGLCIGCACAAIKRK